MKSLVHLTYEIDVPVDKLESVVAAMYACSKPDDIVVEVIIKRGNVSHEEIEAIFSRVTGAQFKIRTLKTRAEVDAIRSASRGDLDPVR